MARQHSQTHYNEDKFFWYMISSKIAKPDSKLASDKGLQRRFTKLGINSHIDLSFCKPRSSNSTTLKCQLIKIFVHV